MRSILIILSIFTLNLYSAEKDSIKSQLTYKSYENDPANMRLYTLENGLKVYLVNNDDKEISSQIIVKSGSGDDPIDNTGLAHYFEHMMFKGTSQLGTSNWKKEKKYLDQIEAEFEKLKLETNQNKRQKIYAKIDKLSIKAGKYAIQGEYNKASNLFAGKAGAFTEKDHTYYTNSFPNTEIEKWAFLESHRFSDVVVRGFLAELEVVYEEYKRHQDSDRKNEDELNSVVIKGSRYEHRVLGNKEHLNNPSIKSIYKFYRDFYVPNNMAIVLVGKFDFDNTINIIEKYFSKLKQNENLDKLKREIKYGITNVETYPKDQINKLSVSQKITDREYVLAFNFKAFSDQDELLELSDIALNSYGKGLFYKIPNMKDRFTVRAEFSKKYNYLGSYLININIKDKDLSFEDVKKEVIEALGNLKSGDFDYDLVKTKLEARKNYDQFNINDSYHVIYSIRNCVARDIEWSNYLDRYNRKLNIKAVDISSFAKDFFSEEKMIIIEKSHSDKKADELLRPNVTPIAINREKHSKFIDQLLQVPSGKVERPKEQEAKSEKKEISNQNVSSLLNDIHWKSIDNDSFFELLFDFKVGSGNKQMKGISIISNPKYIKSFNPVTSELSKKGIRLFFSISNEKTLFGITGPLDSVNNLRSSLELVLDKFVNDIEIDSVTYANDQNRSQNMRQRFIDLASMNVVTEKATNYAFNGVHFKKQNMEKLSAIEDDSNPSFKEIALKINNIFNYNYSVSFKGKEDVEVKKIVSDLFETNSQKLKKAEGLKTIEVKPYLTDGENLYFLETEKFEQYKIIEFAGTFDFNNFNHMYLQVYRKYFGQGLSSIYFQEIRESRSLAYDAMSYIYKEGSGRYILNSSVGTQIEKIYSALEAMRSIMSNELPMDEISFLGVKKSILYELSNKDYAGVNKDIDFMEKMTLNDLKLFFKKAVIPAKKDLLIIGSNKNIDFKKLEKITGKKVIKLGMEDVF